MHSEVHAGSNYMFIESCTISLLVPLKITDFFTEKDWHVQEKGLSKLQHM